MLLMIHETKFYFRHRFDDIVGKSKSCSKYAQFMHAIAYRKYICDTKVSAFGRKFDGKEEYTRKFIDFIQNTLKIYGADDEEEEDGNSDTKTYNEKDIPISGSCIQELENYINEHGKLPEQLSKLLEKDSDK